MNDPKVSSSIPERRGPPVPRFMFKLMNPLMKVLLYSPFHRRVSKSLMLLTFTGRKSGKQFTTPVGYLRKGEIVIVFTHSGWWKNLQGGALVRMRIQGKNITGLGSPVDDPVEIKAMVRDLIASNGEERSRQMGFWVDNPDDTPDNIQNAVAGTIFIRIRVDRRTTIRNTHQ